MKKFYTFFVALFATIAAFAATEQAWYNDVTSIANNGQYYIYSVGGSAFAKAGSATVQAITPKNYKQVSAYLFKIEKAEQGYVTNGSYYLRSNTELLVSSNSGPVCTNSSDKGTKIIWTSMASGTYWNIHSYYEYLGDRYPALYYKDNKYDGYIKHNSGVDYSKTKDLQTATEYRWYLVSQAQLDRHFAIYNYDVYKESIADYTKYENNVPAAYYTQLQNAYSTTYSVKNAEHSKSVVEAHQTALKALYDGAEDMKTAYADAKAKIKALDDVQDKGEGTEIQTAVTNARTALEQATTVADINAAATLKAVDPITFSKTTFDALQSLANVASSEQGQTITYTSSDTKIVNAEMKALYKGTVTITATTAGNDNYYPFKRSATITINPITTTGEETASVCEGTTYPYEGGEYAPGTHTVTLANRNITGGDSIVTLTVNALPVYNVTDGKDICPGELPFTWAGETFTEAGTKTHVFTSINGCDSTVTFTLTVKPVFNTTAEETICPAALPYTWAGETFTEAGTKTHTFTSSYGCDSTVTFTLHVNTAYEVKDSAAICPGELPYTWETETFTEAGTKTLTLQSIVGCDSIVTFTLTVNPTFFTQEEDEMYVGTEKEWHGIDLSVMEVGDTTLVDSLLTVAGCDSVFVLHLTVNELPTTYGTVTAEVCQGTEFEYNGTFYAAGEYTITSKNVLGGDSIITLTVSELPTYVVEQKDTITYGQTYKRGGEELLLNAGDYVYTDSLQTLAGCDSVILTKLAVLKAEQTIEWDFVQCDCFKVGDEFLLIATATSGLEVEFSLTDNNVAAIENNIFKALKAGSVTIIATQDGNENYLPAKPLSETVTIEEELAIDAIQSASHAAKKVVLNGQIYILRDNVLYDLTGKKQE